MKDIIEIRSTLHSGIYRSDRERVARCVLRFNDTGTIRQHLKIWRAYRARIEKLIRSYGSIGAGTTTVIRIRADGTEESAFYELQDLAYARGA